MEKYDCNSAPVLLVAKVHIHVILFRSHKEEIFLHLDTSVGCTMTHKLHGDGVHHVGGGLTSSFGAAPKLLIRGFGGGMYTLRAPR